MFAVIYLSCNPTQAILFISDKYLSKKKLIISTCYIWQHNLFFWSIFWEVIGTVGLCLETRVCHWVKRSKCNETFSRASLAYLEVFQYYSSVRSGRLALLTENKANSVQLSWVGAYAELGKSLLGNSFLEDTADSQNCHIMSFQIRKELKKCKIPYLISVQ